MLSNSRSDIFIRSLKKNPIAKIFERSSFSIEQIYYEAFENYFIYLPDENDEELYFIKKDDVNKIAKNLKTSFKNDLKTNRKHLLN